MKKLLWKDVLGWGFLLWLFGYMLGILFFAFVPPNLLGWVIMPFGIVITLWVLWKKVTLKTMPQYFILGLGWTAIAILLDYFLLVQVFKPADGYYKLDVYLYYILTFLLPLLAGLNKTSHLKK